jgi:dihydropteroate synthase
MHWRLGPSRSLDLTTTHIMGILNCTPDSFSDGGQWRDASHAVDGALAMLEAGATVIDVGGESTRPGAKRVDAQEQCVRVVGVIEGIRRASTVAITVDTTLAAVAEASIDAGADAINDVAAGLEDSDMLSLAARRDCGVVLMHRRVEPEADQFSDAYNADPVYDDVVLDVLQWLEARAQAALAAGVHEAGLCIDPGLGFGKSVAQNWSLIAASDQFVATGRPVLAAASRKSFIGAVTGQADAASRDTASVVVSAMQHAAGVRLFRVHDVAGQARAILAMN